MHPLEKLTLNEITLGVSILRDSLPGVELQLIQLNRHDAPKRDIIPYLEAERLKQELPPAPPRLMKVLGRRMDTKDYFTAVVRLSSSEVLSVYNIPRKYRAPIDLEAYLAIKEAMMNHLDVVSEIKKLDLPESHKLVVDPLPFMEIDPKYGSEERLRYQGFFYIKDSDHPGASQYSLPCALSPIFDFRTQDLVRTEQLPLRDEVVAEPTTKPWKRVKAIQHHHDLIDFKPRTDIKPYNVIQPEGASFTVTGNLIEWQKWRLRVGFHTRDGLVLQNITYDNRNVFYRLSLPEMAIAYGGIRQAFDVGGVGWGISANQLELGCDCLLSSLLGTIHYLDGHGIESTGEPKAEKNVICIHEQDMGILHKHTDAHTGAVTLARSRKLYIFAWHLDQAAGIKLEVRATGVVLTAPIDNEDGFASKYGSNVGPGVFATNHQHLFSLRIDPAIDGYDNTVVYEETVPLPLDAESNPRGTGFVTEQKVLSTSTSLDLDPARNRVFKIRNDKVINKTSPKPVAYQLQLPATQMLLSNPSGPYHRRAIFATKPVWVTQHRDHELWPNGEFTGQTLHDDDITNWVERGDKVEDDDVIVWHTFRFTHNTRPEDFPIMPVETARVGLKPSGFFEMKAALDVPRSTQLFNRSVLHQPSDTEKGCCT
ncbi:copper amine oxidase [Aspergillus venezuelensis]